MASAHTCERKPGAVTCSLHPENNVVCVCVPCQILVCIVCMTSDEHSCHRFKRIQDVTKESREKLYNFNEYLEEFIQKCHSQIKLVQEKKDVLNKGKLSSEKTVQDQASRFKEEIDRLCSCLINEINLKYMQQLEELSKAETETDLISKKALHEQTHCHSVLEQNSSVQVYDDSLKVQSKKLLFILPDIPKLENLDNADATVSASILEGILNITHPKTKTINKPSEHDTKSKSVHLKGELKQPTKTWPAVTGILKTSGLTSNNGLGKNKNRDRGHGCKPKNERGSKNNLQEKSSSNATIVKSSPISTNSLKIVQIIYNEDPYYYDLIPIGCNKAWAIQDNVLTLISFASDTFLEQSQLRNNQSVKGFDFILESETLIASCSDRSIQFIHATTGEMTAKYNYTFEPLHVKCSYFDEILVSEREGEGRLYWCNNATIIRKSKESFFAIDIALSKSKEVYVCCGEKGLYHLNKFLCFLNHYGGQKGTYRQSFCCTSVAVDEEGSILTSDYCNKEIHLLSQKLEFLKLLTLPIPIMPLELKVFGQTIWVSGEDSTKRKLAIFKRS